MRRSDWKKLAHPVGHHAREHFDGELDAGKSNGATYLDIGGDIEAVVRESYEGDEVTIHFEAEDSTRGELTLPKEAFNNE